MNDDNGAISKGGDLDLAALDPAKRPRRKARNRPAPPPELREWEAKAQQRMLSRPFPPNVILEPAGFDQERWTSPHSDVALWTLQLADAFGTRSQAVLSLFMSQLESLCGRGVWDEAAHQWRMQESELSAILALVNAFRPRNEAEAMLAAQMVATHLLAMKVGARALRYDYDTRTAAAYAKIVKAYAMQSEEMRASKGKRRTTRQTITVKKELHQSVHYHDHRGGKQNDYRPHEPTDGPAAEITDQRETLRGKNAGGVVVPLPRSTR
ncbi:MAG: hypothetical protein JNN10_09360 [Sphingopyxis sp.]|uniref:hypothetical protein n=1 Tax=Sphingopyxis sp. TaxID=1908224 RepID=UPI001A51BDA4|nr:hypothetical protein [Sphingopyxis sp.]MBL9066486.1 hypothetical protein [Sphingopyxis sp.]